MANITTSGMGIPSNPNLGADSAKDFARLSTAAPMPSALSPERSKIYTTDVVPFSLAPNISDPSKWSAPGTQG